MESSSATKLPNVGGVHSFNFTKSKPRGFLMPDLIPKISKQRASQSSVTPGVAGLLVRNVAKESDSSSDSEVEESLTPNSLTIADIEKERMERLNRTREHVRSKYSAPPPALYTAAFDQTKKLEKITAYQAERDRELTFRPAPARPAPVFREDEGEVVWNAARIYQADKVLQDAERKAVEKVKEFAITGRDATKFESWQRAEAEREDAENQLRQAVRREELRRAQELLQEEMRLLKEQRQAEVREARGVVLERQEQLAKDREAQIAAKRELVQEVKRWSEALIEQKEQELLAKKEEARKLRDQLGELSFWSKKEREVGLEKARERVRQQREQELANEGRNRDASFDRDAISSTAPVVMIQMSINEMKERLAQEKVKQMEEAQSIRASIFDEKKRRADDLAAKVQRIKGARMNLATQRQRVAADSAVADFEDLQALQLHQEEQTLKTASKIHMKRAAVWSEQLALHHDRKKQTIARRFRAADKSASEEVAVDQHIRAKQRQDAQNEKNTLVDAARAETIRQGEQTRRYKLRVSSATAKERARQDYQQRLEIDRRDENARAAWESDYRSQVHAVRRAAVEKQIEDTRTRGKRPDFDAMFGGESRTPDSKRYEDVAAVASLPDF